MAVTPYPSNLIIFDIDERVLDKPLKLALKRSWTHISDMLVRSHAAEPHADPCNFVRVMVKYGARRYLAAGDEQADALWSERMEQHLLSTMRNISNNAIAFNRQQRNSKEPELSLDYMEISLESGALVLEFRLDSNASLPVECARIATRIRTELGSGALGSPERVRVPSTRSYADQALAWAQAKEAEEARLSREREEKAAEEEEARKAAEEEAEERFMESPELSARVKDEEDRLEEKDRATSPLEVAPLSSEEWEALYGVKDADFAIAYDIWEVVYPDGSSKEYDPEGRRFIAEGIA